MDRSSKMNFNFPIILASQSPRRKELMEKLGIFFTVEVQATDESFPPEMDKTLVAKFLAEQKARAFQNLKADTLLVTADTIVLLENEVLGKPADRQEAKLMLSKLSGKTHKVITGVCFRFNAEYITFDDITEVQFKNLSSREIDHYIETYKPYDKAGAYGIQEWIGLVGIENISGSYFNVMGLPVNLVYKNILALAEAKD